MRAHVSIGRLRSSIRHLPSDRPRVRPGKWYLTQKEHWLGWLREYHGAGFYGRQTDVRRDARFAYNHIVDARMLLWLAKAAGIGARVLTEARSAEQRAKTLQAKAAAVRKVVPWHLIESRLWKSR